MGKDGTYAPVTEEQKKEDEDRFGWESFTVGQKGLQSEDGEYGYEYRIRFTGEKAVYDTNGGVVGDSVPVTDTSTNSANKNCLVDTDTKTLDDNAVVLTLADAAETKIDGTPVVRAFHDATKDNNDLDDGDGTLESPAVKIYDGSALFKDSRAYRVAEVTTVRDGKDETVSGVTSDDVTYTWSWVDLQTYQERQEAYSALTDAEKAGQDFDNFTWQPEGTGAGDGSLADTKNAGVYRLHIHYNGSTDPANAYRPADKDIYFKVEKQQVVVELAGKQFARAGQSTDDWRSGSDRTSMLDTGIAGVYKIPKNNMAYFDETDRDAIDHDAGSFEYLIVSREKTDGQDTGRWVPCGHSVFDGDGTYGVYAAYHDDNYTTADDTAAEEGGQGYKYITEIQWLGSGQLWIEVDRDKVRALGREYNGEAVSLRDGYDFIRIYGDQEKTQDLTGQYLNTTDTYDGTKVNVYWDKDGELYRTGEVVWGGAYSLALRFKGDAAYRPLAFNNDEGPVYGEWAYYEDCAFEIKSIPLTITPKLKAGSALKAGDSADTLAADGLTVTGAVEKDRAYFVYAERMEGSFGSYQYLDGAGDPAPAEHAYDIDKYGGYPAFGKAAGTGGGEARYRIQEDDLEIKEPSDTYLRTGRKYTVRLTNGLAAPLADSYDVTFRPAAATVENRGESRVEGTDFIRNKDGAWEGIDVTYDYADHTCSVKPREAVKFYYEAGYCPVEVQTGSTKKQLIDCNLIAYRIYAPKEFEGDRDGSDFDGNSKNFIYENPVRAAGGYILKDWEAEESDSHYLTVVFPVTETDKGKAFTITWEDGYADTFKLANVVLEADFANAVAPKSIAFNGVQAKMAVGETQALDVRITKAQLGDIVNIRYRIKDGTKSGYISIDPETGVVTALKAGKKPVTVEAYPVRRGEDGELEEITGKGVKTATAKITVTDVTAPAIKSITDISDCRAKVNYTAAGNGYRREIYLIDATANPDAKRWKADTVEGKVRAIKNGQWGDTFAAAPIFLYNDKIDLNTKLACRVLEGLKPANTYLVYIRNVSSARTLADGSVAGLSAKGTVRAFTTTKPQVNGLEVRFDAAESEEKVDKTHPVYMHEDSCHVALSSKSAQVTVEGLFTEQGEGGGAAESTGLRRYTLSPKSNLPKTYQGPKLTYGVFDFGADQYADPWEEGAPASKYAAISAKGRITLKGVDLDGKKTVYIWVRANNGRVGCAALTILAGADSVAGKKAKLKVGDTICLSDCLDYRQGKKKVPGYRSGNTMISDDMIEAARAAGYSVRDAGDACHDWRVTAVSPNRKAFVLEVTDRLGGKEVKAAVSLTSTGLDPVRGLKAAYADDKNITLNFSHAGNPDAFAIEVKDARGNVVGSRLAYRNSDSCVYDYSEKKQAQKKQQWILQNQRLGTDGGQGYDFAYFASTKTYAYTFRSDRLVRLSSYTVSVTPVYGNQEAKAVSRKVKTTNIPADRESDQALGCEGDSWVTTGRFGAEKADWWKDRYVTSGNAYTLSLEGTTAGAKAGMTDTLVWKSSNSKVAGIKANRGTFTAALKALKPGTATISVTSKITKREIARFYVIVESVGNGDSFGGDDGAAGDEDFCRNILAEYDPFYEGALEVLTLSNEVVVGAGDRSRNATWVSFTAPDKGEYDFECTSDYEMYDGESAKVINSRPVLLRAGQKVYFKVSGPFTLRVGARPDTNYESDITLEQGKSASVALHFDKAGIYIIKTETALKDAALSVSFNSDDDDTIYADYTDGFVIARAYDSNSDDLFTITNNGETDITFAVTATIAEAAELSLEENEQTVTVAPREPKLVTIQYDRIFHYTVKTDNEAIKYCEENSNVCDFPYNFKHMLAESRTKSLLLINEGNEEARAALTMDKEEKEEEIEEIAEDQEYTVNIGDFKWFRYTAQEEGLYQFDSSFAMPSCTSKSLGGSFSYSEIALGAGETVYVLLNNSYGFIEKGCFWIKQTKQYSITPDGAPQRITLKPYQTAEAAIKISADGYYALRVDSDYWLDTGSTKNALKYYYDAGDYIICVGRYASEEVFTIRNYNDTEVTFEVSAASVTQNSLDAGKRLTVNMESKEVQVLTCRLSESGLYTVFLNSGTLEYITEDDKVGKNFPYDIDKTNSSEEEYEILLINRTDSSQTAALTLQKEASLEITGEGTKTFTVNAQAQTLITFQAEDNVTYSFSLEGNAQLTDMNGSAASSGFMHKDSKRMLKVINNGDEVAECTLTVTAQAPVMYERLQFNSVQQKLTASYAVPEGKGGYYTIYGYSLDGGTFTLGYKDNHDLSHSKVIIEYSQQYYPNVLLSAGDTLEIDVTLTNALTDNHCAAIRIEFNQEIPLIKGAGEHTVSGAPQGSGTYIEFEADKAAEFTFELTADGSARDFGLRRHNMNAINETKKVWLEKGSKIYVSMLDREEQIEEYTLTVTASSDALWHEVLTFENTEAQPTSYTATENGIYHVLGYIPFYGIGVYTVDCTCGDFYREGTVYRDSYDKVVLNNLYLEKGAEIEFNVFPCNGTSSGSVVIVVEKEEMTLIDGTVGDATIAHVPARGKAWVEYTAAEEAMYNFALSDETEGGSLYVYKADIQVDSAVESPHYMREGDKVLMKVCNDNAQDKACTITITQNKFEPLEFEPGSDSEECELTFQELFEIKCVSFIAPKDGIYNIDASASASVTGGFLLDYKVNDNSFVSGGNWSFPGSSTSSKDIWLNSGDMLYLAIKQQYISGADYNNTISLSIKKNENVNPLSGTVDSEIISVGKGETAWVKYTADIAAYYQFSLMNESSGSIPMSRYYKMNNGGMLEENSLSLPMWLEAGDIFLKLDNSSSADVTYTFRVERKEPLLNKSYVFERYNSTKRIEFKAAERGKYKITVSITDGGDFNVYGGLNNAAVNENQYDWSRNVFSSVSTSTVTCYLNESDIEHIYIRPFNYSENNAGSYGKTLSVRIELEEDEIDVMSGDTMTIPAGSEKYIAYTAKEDQVAAFQCDYEFSWFNAGYLGMREGSAASGTIEYIPIAAGKTIVLKVDNRSETTDKTLTVSTQPSEADSLSEADTTVELQKFSNRSV